MWRKTCPNMTLLLERYYAPVHAGTGHAGGSAGHRRVSPGAGPRYGSPFPAICLTLFTATLALTVNWSALADDLVPERYIQYDEATGVEGKTYMDHYWGEALAGYEGARVLVGLEPNNSFIGLLNYTLAPARFFCPTWDDLESTEALSARLLKDGITHLIFFDESNELYERAMPLAAVGELYSWTLYEVLPRWGGRRKPDRILLLICSQVRWQSMRRACSRMLTTRGIVLRCGILHAFLLPQWLKPQHFSVAAVSV